MLVEDEFLVALDVQDIIESMGCTMDGPYPSRKDALTALQTRRPDCAVLDVRLRDGDVYPLADFLQGAGIPFVFHSGHADDRQLRERYPSALVCAKPCFPSSLQAAIRTAMSSECEETAPQLRQSSTMSMSV